MIFASNRTTDVCLSEGILKGGLSAGSQSHRAGKI